MFKMETRDERPATRLVRKTKRNVQSYLFSFFFLLVFSLSTNAQCAMCRAALGGENNKVQAQAVNDGIVYLMVIPYLLVGAIGYYIYRMRMNRKQE